MSAGPSWSRRFTPGIPLPDGTTLATLDDARAYVLALPAPAQQQPHWQVAIEHLLKAADPPGAGPWLDFARIALMQALHHGRLKPAPRRRTARKYRVVR